jgi:hypothetical protein
MDLAWNCASASGLRSFDMGEGSGSRKGGQAVEKEQ